MASKSRAKPADFDSYFATFPSGTQEKLKQMRAIIGKAAPKAEEVISYAMPAFRQNGILVYFAGYNHHIGFYPTSSGMKAFKNDLQEYKTSKGAVQFPLDKPLPARIISRIVKFRAKENAERASLKK